MAPLSPPAVAQPIAMPRRLGWLSRVAAALMTLIAAAVAPASAQRGPEFIANKGPPQTYTGKIVLVPGWATESPPLYYLENARERTLLLICGSDYGRYVDQAVRVVGSRETNGICADTITPVDPAAVEAQPPTPEQRASYAELCRYGVPPGRIFCTPVVFYPEAGGLTFAEYYTVRTDLDHGNRAMPQFLVDVNGDGKPDYCRFLMKPSPIVGAGLVPVLTCALRNDTGFTEGGLTAPPGFDVGHDYGPRFLVDVDGDGRPDFCRFVGNPASLSCALQRNGGYGKVAQTSGPGFELGHGSRPRFMVDVNGDEKADYCRFVGSADAPMLSCALAVQGGFAGEVKSAPGIDLGHADLGRFMADVNGDRKADFCRFIGEKPATRFSCLLSTGHAFGPGVHQSQPLVPEQKTGQAPGVNPGETEGSYGGGVTSTSRFLVDINKDGRADFCRIVTRPRHPEPFFSCAIATRSGFGNYDTQGYPDLGADYSPRMMTTIH